jgi:hypothetical protein
MKRICVNVTDEQATALKKRAQETGVIQAEQIRRAINLCLFADEQAAKRRVTDNMGYVEDPCFPRPAHVLTAQKAGD